MDRRDSAKKINMVFSRPSTVGWRIVNENFMKESLCDHRPEIRAGYGRVGNQDIGNQDNQNIADVASLGLYDPRYGTSSTMV